VGLIDKYLQGGTTKANGIGQIRSNGRGGFGKGGFSRFGMGNNSFNKIGGSNHMARAMNNNLSPSGLDNTRPFDNNDVEFDED
jgi:hypothetical protein